MNNTNQSKISKTSCLALCLLVVVSGMLLAGCNNNVVMAEAPTEIPTVVQKTGLIVEGNLVPKEFVNLSFNMPGTISEVAVEEGDTVQAGEILARLDQQERLSAAVASAELELTNARQAHKKLLENTAVNTAAGLQSVADARDAVRDAERYLNNLKSGSRGTDLDKARANVVLLNDRLKKAREDFASYENKPEDNITRAKYLSVLADAQRRYDDAVRLLNNLEGTPNDIDLSIAEANLSLAQAQLSLAEKEYQDVQNGPDPDQIEIAQARITSAEAGLEAAHKALDDSQLVAPFSGTVAKLDLKVGEQALPGKLAIVLADLSAWEVETDDLNEMDLPQIQADQTVTVTPDAYPALKLGGKVASISQVSEKKFGDVTYTAKIDLTETDPRLRWGMTVKVDFKQ